MAIAKESIGAHLVGLPPSTARGLHNLFNHLFDEIEQLRGGASKSEVPAPSGDVLPPVGDPPPFVPPPFVVAPGSEPIVPPAATETDAAGNVDVANPDTTPVVEGDAQAAPDATDAPAGLPPAA